MHSLKNFLSLELSSIYMYIVQIYDTLFTNNRLYIYSVLTVAEKPL